MVICKLAILEKILLCMIIYCSHYPMNVVAVYTVMMIFALSLNESGFDECYIYTY